MTHTKKLCGYARMLALTMSATAVSFGATAVQVQVSTVGSGSLSSAPPGSNLIGNPETDPAMDNDSNTPFGAGNVVNRTIATKTGNGPTVPGSGKAKSNPELLLSFDGINHANQRLANGGNQFTLEPPDQGLCAGNGYVLESVNDALRIFDANGNALTGVVDLNTFYGYGAAINRTNGHYGPEITDPSCYFDRDTQRWFQIALTLDRVGVSSALSGKNHIDIAVTTTPSPLGPWIVYRLPVQNDGTDGTPNHFCGGPCLGDYPHIGADANAIFITTNEFSLFGSGFFGAQIYALSKQALASGSPILDALLFDTGDPSIPFCGFTVWPAIASGGVYAGDQGGTEYFLSSDAVCSFTGTSNDIVLWSVSNTKSIDSASPALTLSGQYINVDTYGVPPLSDQKAGDYPFGQCLSDTTIHVTSTLTGCWRYFFGGGGPFVNVEKPIASNDSRMQQVVLANGKLWGALDTAVWVGSAYKAGIAYFVLNPNSGHLFQQGVVAVENNNVTYPAIAVNGSGRGIMAFTLVGADHYPSAAYTSMDEKIGAGDIHVAAEGAGPDDGFTGYRPFGGAPRWGDYGGAVSDGSFLWIASEYIGQTCTLSQYIASSFSCGGTRTSEGNWATRISKLVQ